MSDGGTPADVYHLKSPGIELTYRRSDGKLDIAADDHVLGQRCSRRARDAGARGRPARHCDTARQRPQRGPVARLPATGSATRAPVGDVAEAAIGGDAKERLAGQSGRLVAGLVMPQRETG